jgi:hypothetical protein
MVEGGWVQLELQLEGCLEILLPRIFLFFFLKNYFMLLLLLLPLMRGRGNKLETRGQSQASLVPSPPAPANGPPANGSAAMGASLGRHGLGNSVDGAGIPGGVPDLPRAANGGRRSSAQGESVLRCVSVKGVID